MPNDEKPFSAPEARAALEALKDIIRDNIPADKVDAHAMRLVGESQEMIDDETHALFEALQRQSPSGLPFPRSVAFGLSYALREIVCERILDIEGNAS
jgi:hypothetical protein